MTSPKPGPEITVLKASYRSYTYETDNSEAPYGAMIFHQLYPGISFQAEGQSPAEALTDAFSMAAEHWDLGWDTEEE